MTERIQKYTADSDVKDDLAGIMTQSQEESSRDCRSSNIFRFPLQHIPEAPGQCSAVSH